MKLVLSARARAEYKAIRAYSLREHGPAQASRYRQQFVRAFERLLQFPELGKPVGFIVPGARQIPVGRHVIYYRLCRTGYSFSPSCTNASCPRTFDSARRNSNRGLRLVSVKREDNIRIISVRRARKQEVEYYESP